MLETLINVQEREDQFLGSMLILFSLHKAKCNWEKALSGMEKPSRKANLD